MLNSDTNKEAEVEIKEELCCAVLEYFVMIM